MTSFRAGFSMYNWIDQPPATLDTPGVVIEADSEALTAPATNVAMYEIGVPWTAINLSLSGGAATITFKFGKDRANRCFGLVIPERVDDSGDVDFAPTLGAGDAVRWQVSSSEEPGVVGDVFDSDTDLPAPLTLGFDPTLGVHGFLADADLVGPRVDLTITMAAVPAPPADLFHVGRVWIGPFHEFLVNWQRGTRDVAWVKDDLGHRVRRWTAEFGWVRDSEMPTIRKVAQQVNDDRQIFWWPNALDPAQAMIARFRDPGSFRHKYNNAELWVPTLQEDWLGV